MPAQTNDGKLPDGREQRAVTSALEVRSIEGDDGKRTASGYACLFDNVTDIGGFWREQFAPGAFSKSLQERDVVALHSHNNGRPVGRKSRGTLDIREDERGLAFTNDLPDTSDGRDLVVQIGRGDIEGMSLSFRALKEEWDETVEPPMRTIVEANLYEITYTAFPAYPDTQVGLRSLKNIQQERRDHNKAGARGRIAAKRMKLAQSERNI